MDKNYLVNKTKDENSIDDLIYQVDQKLKSRERFNNSLIKKIIETGDINAILTYIKGTIENLIDINSFNLIWDLNNCKQIRGVFRAFFMEKISNDNPKEKAINTFIQRICIFKRK